jgi:chromosome segregation ATPase
MNNPSSLNDSTNPSPRKSHSKSFVLNNSLTRRDFQTKGKEMWQLKTTRKELDKKLKQLQNRINFLNSEQEKTEKTIDSTKKKHENYSKLRDEVTQEKLKNNEFRSQNEKKLYAQQQENLLKAKNLQEKIKQNKTKLVKENQMQRTQMISQIKESYMNTVLEIEAELKRKQKITCEIHENIKKIHHRKNLSLHCLTLQKDEEYLKKIQKEIENQEETKQKIIQLEKIEQECMEKLQSTQKLKQTVNSILSSPVNKSLNFLIFNL